MNILKFIGKKRRPVNLFYMELIIALLFFIVSAAVILKVFATADRKSRLSSVKENAMICSQSIAEVYSENGNAPETFLTVFSENAFFDIDSGIYTIKLDEQCKLSDDGNIVMEAVEKRENTDAGELSHLSVSFISDNEELFSIVCSSYVPNGGVSDA